MDNKVVNKDASTRRESFTELLGQLASTSAAVVHDEIELVIQGIREKVRAARSGVLLVATGAVIGFGAFMSLCAASIIGLASYMAPVIAALVTGAATQNILERGAEIYGEAEQTVSEVYDKTAQAVSETYEKAKSYSEGNPGKTVLVALGIGVGVGFLLGARSRRSRTGRFAQPVVNALSEIALELFR